MHSESIYIWLSIPIVLLILYVLFGRKRRTCMCRKQERYTYNENQPKVGISGQPIYLQPYNDFKRSPLENYKNLYYHRVKENPEYNDNFHGV